MEEAKKPDPAGQYIKGIMERAHEVARNARSITVEPEHVMASVLEHMESAFVFDQLAAARIIDMEARIRLLEEEEEDEDEEEDVEKTEWN